MARYTPPSSVGTLAGLKTELDKIKDAINDTLSRKSDTPNQMETDLDMNSNQILNLPVPNSPTSPVRVQDIPNYVSQSQGSVYVGETAPVGFNGMRWYNPSIPRTYIYYEDGTSGQWVEESSESTDGGIREDLKLLNSTVQIAGVPASQVVGELTKNQKSELNPVMVEQFVSLLGGRGMLSSETPRIVTERLITTSEIAGADVVAVASTTGIVLGSRVVIYHSSVGLYETYFVSSLTPTTIGLSTGLKYPVTAGACKLERLWYDQAHPGKFYMRLLAQKIAKSPEVQLTVPKGGRLYFSQFDSDPTNANDLASAIGGATLAYIDELNISQGDVSKPLESMIGKSLFIEGATNGFGAELPAFRTFGATSAIISAVIMCRDPSVSIELRLTDDDGFVQNVISVDKSQLRNVGFYKYPIKLSARTKNLKLSIVAASGVTGPTSVIVDQVEIFESSSISNLPVVDAGKKVKIVGLGDSWIAGDLVTTPERESILTQLQAELPNATIINAGIGGQKVWEMYNRFEADVAVHKPDFVIVNTGTNDCYSPISGVFFPNSVDQFERFYNLLIGKIMAIGAKPILIGVPALAQLDGSFTDWTLNNRAKMYSRYFYKRFSQVVDYSTPAPTPETPTVISFVPELRVNNSPSGITYSSRSGNYSVSGKVVAFNLTLSLSNKGSSTGLVTIEMPPVSPAAGHVNPFATICSNVVSALGMQAVGSISATGQMRLQIPTASGTAAATEANLTNTTTLWISGSYLTS